MSPPTADLVVVRVVSHLPFDPPPGAPDLQAGLKRLGYESFRPGQREAIETLLERGRVLLVAPTGGGKSLTYQLPAAVLPGTALVISPLVSRRTSRCRVQLALSP
jgi:ATP-dependent DNA helicase RecQ